MTPFWTQRRSRAIPASAGRMTALFLLIVVLASIAVASFRSGYSFEERHSPRTTGPEVHDAVFPVGDTARSVDRSKPPFILRLPGTESRDYIPILDSTRAIKLRSGLVTLQPGKDVGSHNTGQHEEILIILHGTGLVDIGGVGKKEIEEGMAIYIPPNNQHDVYGTGNSPLKYIYVVSPVR